MALRRYPGADSVEAIGPGDREIFRPRSSQTTAAGGRIHVVQTANAVPGAPSVGAIVKNPRRSLRPIQDPAGCAR